MSKKQNKTKRIKMGFRQRTMISISDFSGYVLVGAEGPKEAIKYLLLLSMIFSVIISCGLCFKTGSIAKSGIEQLAYTEDFSFENGELKTNLKNDEKGEYKDPKFSNFKVLVFNKTYDDSEVRREVKDFSGDLIVFTKNEMIVKLRSINASSLSSQNEDNSIYSVNYKDLQERLGKDTIEKGDVINLLNNISDIRIMIPEFISMFISITITKVISLIIDGLIIAVIGVFLSRILGLPITYPALFSMATSCLVIPIFLNIINSLLGILTTFYIKNFTTLYYLIAILYLLLSLLATRAELVKPNMGFSFANANKLVKNKPEEKSKENSDNKKQNNRDENNKTNQDENKDENTNNNDGELGKE